MLRATSDDQPRLMQEWGQARARTDALFGTVPASLLYQRTIAERHRIAFYIGHLEAFDANLLQQISPVPDGARLQHLFAFGIDPINGVLPHDEVADWPELAVIHEFVQGTRQHLDQWLMGHPPTALDGIALTTLLHTAVEHRWMHAETLAYLLNRLPVIKPLRRLEARGQRFGDDELRAIPAGTVTLGRERDQPGFGWDNEYDAQQVFVPAFEIDRYMVSNGQFLRFVEAGGYRESRWWSPEAWSWLQQAGIEHPAAWSTASDGWRLPSLSDQVELQPDWPVFVSHAEAEAYARWVGKVLPSEAQWQRAAYGTTHDDERDYPWGDASPTALHGNFDFERWDPMPVDAHPAGASAFGVEGLIGNGWEWTCTAFAPLPGFQPFPFYRGYSADFFDGRHWVQKGGSAHTALRLLRRSFRNWFQPHYPYAFAGFRCVRPT